MITAISLAVVFFNATSGSVAYARMKRVDYKSGIVFAIATIPGAILGAISTAYLPRGIFDVIFGVLMIIAGIYLWFSPGNVVRDQRTNDHLSTLRAGAFWTERQLTDAYGITYQYAFNPSVGVVLSIFVGFV